MNNQIVNTVFTKVCSKCQEEKPLNEFCKCKNYKDGLNYTCKNCVKQYSLEHKKENKLYHKQHHQKNKDKINLKHRQDYLKNKDKINLKHKKYNLEHKEEINLWRKQWNLKNKDKRNLYIHQKYQNDINFKIVSNYRTRIRKAVKGICKSAHTLSLIMCSIPKLKGHLEQQWLTGMTWDNWGYGKNKWNIDHIIPCSFFNMLDPVEQYMCFRWQNLQPLWQTDNFEKKDKIVY